MEYMKQMEKTMKIKTYKGAGIALFKKNSDVYCILLGKRTINPDKGKWSIFDGKREPFDKSSFETAKREFKEECALSFSSIKTKSFGECKFNLPFFKWTTFIFEVSESFRIPKHFGFKFSELHFIPTNELKKYTVAFGVKKEIRTFLKNSAKIQKMCYN